MHNLLPFNEFVLSHTYMYYHTSRVCCIIVSFIDVTKLYIYISSLEFTGHHKYLSPLPFKLIVKMFIFLKIIWMRSLNIWFYFVDDAEKPQMYKFKCYSFYKDTTGVNFLRPLAPNTYIFWNHLFSLLPYRLLYLIITIFIIVIFNNFYLFSIIK